MIFKSNKAESAPVPVKAPVPPPSAPAQVAAPVPLAPVSDPMLRVVPPAVVEFEDAVKFLREQANKPVQRQSDAVEAYKAAVKAGSAAQVAKDLKAYQEKFKEYGSALNEGSALPHESISQGFLGQRMRETWNYMRQAMTHLQEASSTIQSFTIEDVNALSVSDRIKKIIGPYGQYLREGHLQNTLDVIVREVKKAKGARAARYSPAGADLTSLSAANRHARTVDTDSAA